jgi:hypothetical protein
MDWKILALGVGIAIALSASTAKATTKFDSCTMDKSKPFSQCMGAANNPPSSPERGSRRQKPR